MIAGWIHSKTLDQWHFFAGGRSLCRKVAVITTGKVELIDRDDNDSDNCVECRERLERIKEAQTSARKN